jgi:hypothetical protein
MLISYKKRNVLIAGNSRFVPGVNSIRNDTWQQLQKDHRLIRKMLEYGELEIVSADEDEEVEVSSGSAFDDLGRFNDRTATKVVKDTYDLGTLRAWHDLENRESVRSAINEQIRQIEATEPKKKSNR